jgi:hypothetical protein
MGEGRVYLCGEVLEDGREVDGCAGADALRVLAGLEEVRDAADRERQPDLGRLRDRLGKNEWRRAVAKRRNEWRRAIRWITYLDESLGENKGWSVRMCSN